jgi:hypothetical protein
MLRTSGCLGPIPNSEAGSARPVSGAAGHAAPGAAGLLRCDAGGVFDADKGVVAHLRGPGGQGADELCALLGIVHPNAWDKYRTCPVQWARTS